MRFDDIRIGVFIILSVVGCGAGGVSVGTGAGERWGQRDDPFRAHANRDVVWAWFDASGATAMHFARLHSGGTATCASF